MLAALFNTRRQPQNFGFTESRRTHDGGDRRLSFRKSTGFVHDERVDFFHYFEGFGILDQYSGSGAAADCNHNRHGRRQAERARAGDDQNRNRVQQRVRKPRFGPGAPPNDEGDNRYNHDGGNEIAGHDIGKSLNRCAAPLRLADHRNNLRQESVFPDTVRSHDEGAGFVNRSADDAVARGFFDRNGFPGDHGFINGTLAFDGHAVHRDLLARTDSEPVTDMHLVQRDVLFRAVRQQPPRRFGSQSEKGLDCRASPASCPEFKNLAEQDQCSDDCGGLKVDG